MFDYLLLLIITVISILVVISFQKNKKIKIALTSSINQIPIQIKIVVNKLSFANSHFQITKLPHVAFKNVIHSMGFNEVVTMSRTSTCFRRRLRRANRKIFKIIIECHEDIFPLFPKKEIRRILVFENHRDLQFAYYFMTNERQHKGNNWTAQFDVYFYISLLCMRHKKGNKSPSLPYTTYHELMNYLNILNYTFKIDHVDLIIDKDRFYGEFKTALSHPLFRKCHFIQLLGHKSYITTENIEFILKNFDLKHGFKNQCVQTTGFNNKLWANIPRLDFQPYSNLTLDDLKEMNCEKIKFDYLHGLSGTQLNEYIRYWLDGNVPKLRRFQLNLNYCFDDWTADLWDGLPHSEWNPKQRARFFYDDLEFVDCSKGRDIERSDGLLATILIESKVLYFLIWHDRFPVDARKLFNCSEN